MSSSSSCDNFMLIFSILSLYPCVPHLILLSATLFVVRCPYMHRRKYSLLCMVDSTGQFIFMSPPHPLVRSIEMPVSKICLGPMNHCTYASFYSPHIHHRTISLPFTCAHIILFTVTCVFLYIGLQICMLWPSSCGLEFIQREL